MNEYKQLATKNHNFYHPFQGNSKIFTYLSRMLPLEVHKFSVVHDLKSGSKL